MTWRRFFWKNLIGYALFYCGMLFRSEKEIYAKFKKRELQMISVTPFFRSIVHNSISRM